METLESSPSSRFRLDLGRYQLLDGTSPVALERQPMELLKLLAERPGQLVSREEIAAALWRDGVFVDTDRNINSIVRKVRQALKDNPDQPKFVETVIGKGYRLIGPVEISPKEPAATATPPIEPEFLPPPVDIHARRRPIGWAWALTACIAVAAAVWFVVRTARTDGADPPIRSIAILPLENVSGDAAKEYFADGMTQELTTELAQNQDLRVISHTSVQQYKGSRKSVPEIARELHADALIEGSVLASGDRVRVTAQLIRATSDRSIWSNSYERDMRDVVGLQRNLAEDIAEQVKIKLRIDKTAKSAKQVIPAAHDAYLRGLYEYDKSTEASLRAAIANFQQAIAQQPNYAEPYAAMADSYVQLGVLYWPPPQAMPQAKTAALKALELDPNLSDAHEALGSVYYYYEWDWPATEREARTAIALNPSNPYAHDLLGAYYGTLGRFQENRHELQLGRELDPHSSVILADIVFWTFMSRDYDLAISSGEEVVSAQPDNAFAHAFLGMAYAKKGNVRDALQHADLARHYDDGPLIASFRANVYAIAGRKKEATSALNIVEKLRPERYSCAYELGVAYFLLNQNDSGFYWLDQAYQGRSECMILVKVDPRVDSVRGDARYKSLLHLVGLDGQP